MPNGHRNVLGFQKTTRLLGSVTRKSRTETVHMRYLIPLIVAAFLSFGVVGGEVDAGQKPCNCPRCQQVRRAHPPNVFQQLLELERRKNAWLRKTFLGK